MTWTPQKTTLADLAALLERQGNLVCAVQGAQEAQLPVARLSSDSRAVAQGTLFFCKGARFEPRFLAEAAHAGACAYVGEVEQKDALLAAAAGAGYKTEPEAKDTPLLALPTLPTLLALPALFVHDMRTALADTAAYFYRGALDKLAIAGFTGTKGKSTTVWLLHSIINAWLAAEGRPPSAVLSGIENDDGIARTPARLTTEEPLELWQHFANAAHSGASHLTMEVSSQALKYHRTRGVPFKVAGFLNIGADHVGPLEHPNHEDYLASKLLIFKQAECALINLDTPELPRVLAAAQAAGNRLFSFSLEGTSAPAALASEAHLYARELTAGSTGTSFTAQGPRWCERFELPLPGRFNVANALAALTAAEALGIPLEYCQLGLASARVPGRMELIAGERNQHILIDYAHNQLSFETVFATVRQSYPTRPLVCVFGATGDKGIERRLGMAQVAARYAHTVVLTEDDAGSEPLAHINAQMAEVLKAAGTPYRIVDDRTEAIAHALATAPADALILVLGKGHEATMKRGHQAVPVPTDAQRVHSLLAKNTNSGEC